MPTSVVDAAIFKCDAKVKIHDSKGAGLRIEAAGTSECSTKRMVERWHGMQSFIGYRDTGWISVEKKTQGKGERVENDKAISGTYEG